MPCCQVSMEHILKLNFYWRVKQDLKKEKKESEVTQSCPTLCDPMVCSPPGSSVHGESPARITGVPFPSPGDLPNPGIESRSPALQAFSLPPEPPGKLS